MRSYALSVENLDRQWQEIIGRVSARNVPDFERGTGYFFRKGDFFTPELLPKLSAWAKAAPSDYWLHLIELTEDEIGEDEAGLRLARLVAGPGVQLTAPVESRVNLIAQQRGLLKIEVARLNAVNEIPGLAVFTLFDNMAVEAGTEVAGAKVTPLVYPAHRLAEVGQLCQHGPIIDVRPFQPLKVGVIVREQLKPKPRARFAQAVEQKIRWFGGQLLEIGLAEDTPGAIAEWLTKFATAQADLILHVGGHSSDPLDPMFPGLQQVGAKMVRLGAPAHPGTLFWLADYGTATIFGLASCGMFSKTTLGDLFLARFFAGEKLTSQEIAQMGYGGLFTREMAFRFPPYGLPVDDSI